MSDPRPDPAEEMPQDDEEEEGEGGKREEFDRSRDLLGPRNSKCRKKLDKLLERIIRGFRDQATRSNNLDKWWDIYNCVLGDEQFYNGTATVFVPIIHDAIEARATRFTNQLFPASGHYVDCTAADGEQPYAMLALVNDYIRKAKFKTDVVKPLFVTADVEGQYNLYIDWDEIERVVVSRETHGPILDVRGGEIEDDSDEIEDIVEEEVVEGLPGFEVLHDSDVLILPVNTDGGVAKALARGGAGVVVRRWTEDDIDAMIDAGEILKQEGEDLKGVLVGGGGDSNATNDGDGLPDVTKEIIKAIGIRSPGKHVMVFEVWTMLPLDESGKYAEDGKKRLCRVWMGMNRQMLGCKRNPYWNDRCPLISEPAVKIAGSAKGQSRVEPLAAIQYEANDAANERADSDHYSAMPIIMRKPGERNQPLILNLAAVWDVDPNDVKFAEFPDLSARGRARVQDAIAIIFQSLSVNPAMIAQQTGRAGSKRNQAEIANEQAVDLLTTAEAVSAAQEKVLDPAISWVIDLDHQFRRLPLRVRAYGELGVDAAMMDIPPIQNGAAYMVTWNGGEQARQNAALQQGGTALINVMRGLQQPLQQEGIELRIAPFLEKMVLNVAGPKIARLTIRDMRHELTMDPALENVMLAEGHMVMVHKLDIDQKHLQEHQALFQESGDPHGNIQVHIQQHVAQMNAKIQAQQSQMMAAMMKMMSGAQGVPGGGGPQGPPGVAGTPRPGAVPGQPRPQGPPGMVHRDQLPRAGGGSVVPMPRKM